MKGKRLAAIIIVLVLVAGGVVFALKSGDDNQDAQSSTTTGTTEQETTGDDTQPAARTSGPHGNYITLADYNGSKSSYSNDSKVLFFHAPWCPVCQSIDKEINANPGKVPEGDTIIKTDFDSQTDLKKKYGVTYQYTFVQIDNDGQQIKKWSASTLDDVISQIE